MAKIIVDGENAIAGRLGSYVAKTLLKGDSVDIINSEKVIVSGKKEIFIGKLKRLGEMGRGGSLKGPKILRQEDRILKRLIRGMLPWDRPKGRDAYKRLRCYIGNNLKEDEMKAVVVLDHKRPLKFATIEQIRKFL